MQIFPDFFKSGNQRAGLLGQIYSVKCPIFQDIFDRFPQIRVNFGVFAEFFEDVFAYGLCQNRAGIGNVKTFSRQFFLKIGYDLTVGGEGKTQEFFLVFSSPVTRQVRFELFSFIPAFLSFVFKPVFAGGHDDLVGLRLRQRVFAEHFDQFVGCQVGQIV